MKKLLLPGFFLLLFSLTAVAQEKQPANSLAVVMGPNRYTQLPELQSERVSYDPEWGYTVGLNYAREFKKGWYGTLGLRYNIWNSTVNIVGLIFETELLSGEFDPTLPHDHYAISQTDRAWQLLAGAGWHSQPRKWRLSTCLEAGVTNITQKTTGGDQVIRLTLGAHIGPEYRLNRHFGLFMMPGARFVFNKINHTEDTGSSFLALQLETGMRYHF